MQTGFFSCALHHEGMDHGERKKNARIVGEHCPTLPRLWLHSTKSFGSPNQVENNSPLEQMKSIDSLLNQEVDGPSQSWAVLNGLEALQIHLRFLSEFILESPYKRISNMYLYLGVDAKVLELDA